MNVVLLGSTGFIGSHVTRLLVEAGHHVTLFHRGKTHMEVPASVRSIYGDRAQLGEFKEQFMAVNPRVVVDMMALGEEEARAVVETFRGVARRSVVISSMDVYRAYGQLGGTEEGEPDSRPLDEEAPLRSHLYPYRGLSKQAGDLYDRYDKILVERVAMEEAELPVTILRLPAVYGPGDRQHRVGSYLKQMKKGEVSLSAAQARWKSTRGFVEDVAQAIVLAATDNRAQKRIYNVGEPTNLTELEWVQAIARAAHWNGPITIDENAVPDGPDYRFHLNADTSRIRSELGYQELFSPEEALARSVEWERAQKQS